MFFFLFIVWVVVICFYCFFWVVIIGVLIFVVVLSFYLLCWGLIFVGLVEISVVFCVVVGMGFRFGVVVGSYRCKGNCGFEGLGVLEERCCI